MAVSGYAGAVIDATVYEWKISWQLLVWAGLSLVAGSVILVATGAAGAAGGHQPLRGFSIQAVAWGGINGAIALWGMIRAARTARSTPDEQRSVRRVLRLRRILGINAALDVVYVAAGIALVVFLFHRPEVRGHGAGVAVQGLFLLFFDLYHRAVLPAHPPAWYDTAP